jgi:hypothetical protein
MLKGHEHFDNRLLDSRQHLEDPLIKDPSRRLEELLQSPVCPVVIQNIRKEEVKGGSREDQKCSSLLKNNCGLLYYFNLIHRRNQNPTLEIRGSKSGTNGTQNSSIYFLREFPSTQSWNISGSMSV